MYIYLQNVKNNFLKIFATIVGCPSISTFKFSLFIPKQSKDSRQPLTRVVQGIGMDMSDDWLCGHSHFLHEFGFLLKAATMTELWILGKCSLIPCTLNEDPTQ